MTVQELIDQLHMVSDKRVQVTILYERIACGSSRTGAYGCGEEPIKIDEVRQVEADELAALNDIDAADHIELISEELIDRI